MEFALLQNAQQLGLRGGVQIADFIEEDRAAVGQFELASARGDGAGERALLVAEQLAFESARTGIAAQFTLTNGPAANGLS